MYMSIALDTLGKNRAAIAVPVVVKRDEIPAITHLTINGVARYIGEVRDFRGHPALREFLPDQGRASLSWVCLGAGEINRVHTHPTASMVVICEGGGRLIGDTEQPVEAGDLVIIPSNALHGFKCGADRGLRGLSIQFEGVGLYENSDKPLIAVDARDRFEPLVAAQARAVERFRHNRLVKLVKSEGILTDAETKTRLLDVLQVWSDHFQKLIRIRAASAKDPGFAALADEHMQDELGHNEILAELRDHRPVNIWDPALESIAAWFMERMQHASDTDTTVLMHLVIEEAGDVFHKHAAPVFPKARHFEFHCAHDEDHAEMGLQALKQHSPESVAHMLEVLDHGWAMMDALCNRMADLAVGGTRSLCAKGCGPRLDQRPASARQGGLELAGEGRVRLAGGI